MFRSPLNIVIKLDDTWFTKKDDFILKKKIGDVNTTKNI